MSFRSHFRFAQTNPVAAEGAAELLGFPGAGAAAMCIEVVVSRN
jgi:hypothetical protein